MCWSSQAVNFKGAERSQMRRPWAGRGGSCSCSLRTFSTHRSGATEPPHPLHLLLAARKSPKMRVRLLKRPTCRHTEDFLMVTFLSFLLRIHECLRRTATNSQHVPEETQASSWCPPPSLHKPASEDDSSSGRLLFNANVTLTPPPLLH